MNKTNTGFFAALVCLISAATLAQDSAPTDAPWVELGKDAGITVSRKKVPGDPVYAYKGEGILEAPLGKIITVSRDTSRQPEWVNRLEIAKILHQITPYDRVVYLKMKAPWPVKDRDFVVESKLTVDRAKKTAVFTMRSVEDPQTPPNPCCVRAVVRGNRAELKAIDDTHTQVSAEAHVDPRGSLPAWLVNLIQKTFPHKSIDGMLRQVAKPDIQDFFVETRD